MTITVTGQQVKSFTEVIFWVQQNNNSPYQGRLLYDATVYAGMTAQQVKADGLAQFNAWLAAQVLTADQLTAQEIGSNLDQVVTQGSLASISLANSTPAANIAALRVAYQTSTQTQAIMIGDFLNTLTNAQLQTAFSINLAQAQALRANKLVPAAALATSIRAAVGQ